VIPASNSHGAATRNQLTRVLPQLYARLPEDCDREELTLSCDVSTAVCREVDWKPDVHVVENFDGAGRR
jgi:hypothetical protein